MTQMDRDDHRCGHVRAIWRTTGVGTSPDSVVLLENPQTKGPGRVAMVTRAILIAGRHLCSSLSICVICENAVYRSPVVRTRPFSFRPPGAALSDPSKQLHQRS